MAEINELIGGYKLRTLLQTGQTSQVFEVVEPSSNQHRAMKLLLPEAASDAEQRKNLFNEAEIGTKLAHQNVIRIYKVNRSPESPHFIMEFFPSGSLRLRLQAKEVQFIRNHARKIFKEAATGLAYMNAMGYIHRDVKPDNILVNSMGDTKIIDFAITKKYAAQGMLGKLMRPKRRPQGTPSFMSPEQIKDDNLDTRADIYSYGCTLYELTTGRKPFTGSTQQDLLSRHFTEKAMSPANLNKELTDEFGALVLHTMAKKKEDRPKNFHEVLMALQKIKIFKEEKVERGADGEFVTVTNREAAAATESREVECGRCGLKWKLRQNDALGEKCRKCSAPQKEFKVTAGAVVEPVAAPKAPTNVTQGSSITEHPDVICLACKYKWKVRRTEGLPAKCGKCGAKQDQLQFLNAEGEKKRPPAIPDNPDDIDIDAL